MKQSQLLLELVPVILHGQVALLRVLDVVLCFICKQLHSSSRLVLLIWEIHFGLNYLLYHFPNSSESYFLPWSEHGNQC